MLRMVTFPAPDAAQSLRDAATRIDRDDAVLLLAHALQRAPAWLYAHATEPLTPGVAAVFRTLVARRAAGEPVAYLIGRRGFWTLDLAVSPAVLIPRPETELLVELALARLPPAQPVRIADLGTGSGAVALALASERPQAEVLASDASAQALDVAAANAAAHGIGNIVFRRGDWWQALSGERFDLVASNPPYIAAGDPHLGRGDLRFEPADALASGVDGLDAIRSIVAGTPMHLMAGGWLLLEHGHDQGRAVAALLHAAGFADVATHRDLEQRDRVTLGRLPAAGQARTDC